MLLCITFPPNRLWDTGGGHDDRLGGPLCDGRVQALGLVIGRGSVAVVPEARVIEVGRSGLQRGEEKSFFILYLYKMLHSIFLILCICYILWS